MTKEGGVGQIFNEKRTKKVKAKKQVADKGVLKEKRKKRKHNIKCTWVLHASPDLKTNRWSIKRLDDKHVCQFTRIIKHCTSDYLATKLAAQLPSNPTIPTNAVKVQLEAQTELKFSKFKAYRALKKALDAMKGDYKDQYGDLRCYGQELIRCNPGTTVKIQTQLCESSDTENLFQRIYICLGPLKQGFKACGRDLLGVDGAFMKQPATGHLLTAVGLDSNNGILPVAYAVVEQENYNSWSWFLDCLGRDLDLDTNSNFTFISDRQKGLSQAILRIFPCAEHRYCVRHIHENMKTRGNSARNATSIYPRSHHVNGQEATLQVGLNLMCC
ncbi:uncharacterized protein [Rutidosis leptorrhynchoides]|uniref:uncharacterized protein n=1 Tax=Rutidosis leptorrhynchoides TaxID=125765 RepID=UPI003A98FF4A